LYLNPCTPNLQSNPQPFHRDKSEYLTFQRISVRAFEIPDCCPDDARDLIDRLLQTDPEARLGSGGFDEIKNHPFFAGTYLRRSTPHPRSDSSSPNP